MYALVTTSELKEVTRLPKVARKLVDGEPTGDWVSDFNNANDELKAACGYLPITEDEKLTLKSNQYLERNLVMRYEKPVIEWKRRIKPLDTQVADAKATIDVRNLEGVGDAVVALEKFIALTDPSLTHIREIVKTLAILVKEGLPDA